MQQNKLHMMWDSSFRKAIYRGLCAWGAATSLNLSKTTAILRGYLL